MVFQFCENLKMVNVGEEQMKVLTNSQRNELYSFSSVSVLKPCLYLQYMDIINFSPGICHSTYARSGGKGFATKRTKTNLDGGG